MYDENGEAFGFNYNGNDYYYVRNAQNDVVRIVDSANETVVSYQYDSWGKLLSCEDTSENDIVSFINPYTYRGYFYEIETNTYFLKSRYYNPELCRFISADGYVQTGQGMLDKNMFAYCGNNPVNRVDYTGSSWKSIGKWLQNKWNGFKNWVSNTFGTENASVFIDDSIPAVDISNLIPASASVGNRKNTQKKPSSKSKPVMAYSQYRSDAVIASSCGIKINFKNQCYDLSLGLENIGFSKSTYFSDNFYSSKGVKMDLSRMQVGVEVSTTGISWNSDNQIENTDYIYYNISLVWPYAAVCALIGATSIPEYCGSSPLQPLPAS